MEKYWLTLSSESFLWQKGEQGMIYNTRHYKKFIFSNKENIKQICDTLSVIDNLYTIEIADLSAIDLATKKWIAQIIELKLGELTPETNKENKPVSLYPFLKLQKKETHFILEQKDGTGGNIIKYLHEITIYLNGSPNGNTQYYKQDLYPICTNNELQIDALKTFVYECRGGFLSNINIVGDIFNYSESKELLNWLYTDLTEKNFYVTITDLFSNPQTINWTHYQKVTLNIICDNLALLHKIKQIMDIEKLNIIYIFPITSEEKYEEISLSIENNKITNYEIKPFLTKYNQQFFHDNIYTSEDDLCDIKLSKREIFAHQALNTNFFGKLIIMPDGKIYSNVNQSPIGNINDTIYDLLYKEIVEGTSWRMIRDQKPCSDCVYQWLCPSPSNYELVLGKPNLCHIKTK